MYRRLVIKPSISAIFKDFMILTHSSLVQQVQIDSINSIRLAEARAVNAIAQASFAAYTAIGDLSTTAVNAYNDAARTAADVNSIALNLFSSKNIHRFLF